MTKNHRSGHHHRNVKATNGYDNHAKPKCYRPNDSYTQPGIVSASREEMISSRKGGLRLTHRLNTEFSLR